MGHQANMIESKLLLVLIWRLCDGRLLGPEISGISIFFRWTSSGTENLMASVHIELDTLHVASWHFIVTTCVTLASDFYGISFNKAITSRYPLEKWHGVWKTILSTEFAMPVPFKHHSKKVHCKPLSGWGFKNTPPEDWTFIANVVPAQGSPFPTMDSVFSPFFFWAEFLRNLMVPTGWSFILLRQGGPWDDTLAV